MDIFDEERVVGCLGDFLAIFFRIEDEEKSDLVKVDDDLLTVGAGLVRISKGLEDRDWNGTDSGRRRVLLCMGHKLLSQAKVERSHLFLSGVVGSHGCK